MTQVHGCLVQPRWELIWSENVSTPHNKRNKSKGRVEFG
jgi:hypothetical protein